jgi:hypothetical protein
VETNQEQDTTDGAEAEDPLHVPNPWDDQETDAPTIEGPSRPIDMAQARAHTIAGSRFEHEVPKAAVIVTQKQPIHDQASNVPEMAGGIFYEVIGECYVDDKMDGEACPRFIPADQETEFTLI